MAQVTHEARRASGCPWRRVFNRAWMCVGESLLRACVHILHAGWIHAFRMFMHVPECESERLCDTYACLSHPAYDSYLSVGRQFHCRADVRVSISPSCFHFQMVLDFARPYCSIMTFWLCSQVQHQALLRHSNKETKTWIKSVFYWVSLNSNLCPQGQKVHFSLAAAIENCLFLDYLILSINCSSLRSWFLLF